jgi:hypothetical protein
MATTHDQYQDAWSHDHAGARWLAPFLIAVFLTVLGLAFMLVYPHLSLSGQV